MELFERDFSKYEPAIKERALQAFKDDLGCGDITTEAVFNGAGEDRASRAVITAEQDCVLAGVLEARAIFEDGGLEVIGKKDGDMVKKGKTVLTISGSVKELLARERVALNYLSRMSGIATVSRRLADQYGKKVLFLRKTDPGLLFSEKRAVALGGCLPHRMNLSDGILIKDNHINELAKGGTRLDAMKMAIIRADEFRSGQAQMPIEIEVETVEEARFAAEELRDLQGPNIIMLDNMRPQDVKRASNMVKSVNHEITIEASGGITEENIKDYLDAGADFVSTSMFLSAKNCGFSMEMGTK